MAEANWYWVESDRQMGPAAPGALGQMIASGKLGARNLVWQEGMAEWAPIAQVPALARYLQAPAAARPAAIGASASPAPMQTVFDPGVTRTSTAQVGYYNPSGTLPPRAAQALRKHAQPRGDVGDWPLDDMRVAQFDEAWKLRKRILAAVSLFRLLLLLMIVGDVAGVVIMIMVVIDLKGPTSGAYMLGFVGTSIVIYGGLTALSYFAWKSTLRSQRWAPITMGIVMILAGIFYVGLLLFTVSGRSRGDPTPLIIGSVIFAGIAGLLAYVSFRASTAIPAYLRQPAWCQELLSMTG